jgi:hypothetical protein
MTTALTRRHVLVTALATGVAVPLGAGGGWAVPAAPGPARLTLPPPTGPHRVGTASLHLVDGSRPDPVAGPGHHRELMASVWYPATRDAQRHPVAPWMTAAPMRALLAANGFDADAATAPLTAGHESAAALRTPDRLPVIVFSHGARGHRSETTIVVQELASHGYVVVTVDHTYDGFSEFPDGRLTVPVDDVFDTPWDHARDIQFVLDRIEDLAAGRNPDAETDHRVRCPRSPDLGRCHPPGAHARPDRHPHRRHRRAHRAIPAGEVPGRFRLPRPGQGSPRSGHRPTVEAAQRRYARADRRLPGRPQSPVVPTYSRRTRHLADQVVAAAAALHRPP